jgi:hypothetical protein
MNLSGSSAQAAVGTAQNRVSTSHKDRDTIWDITSNRVATPSPDLVPPPCGFLQVGSRFDVQQPAAQRDGDGVGAIVRAELVDQVLDVEVDRGLRNPQVIGDLFIAMPVAYQPQDVKFASGQRRLTQVLGQTGRDLDRYVLSAGVRQTNGGQDLIVGHALEQVGHRPGSHRPLNFRRTCST